MKVKILANTCTLTGMKTNHPDCGQTVEREILRLYTGLYKIPAANIQVTKITLDDPKVLFAQAIGWNDQLWWEHALALNNLISHPAAESFAKHPDEVQALLKATRLLADDYTNFPSYLIVDNWLTMHTVLSEDMAVDIQRYPEHHCIIELDVTLPDD